jgi:hypothetical protein
MPDWRFQLVDYVYPYSGELKRPAQMVSNLKIVACEVALLNMSDQPMEFAVRDIRLRDLDGIEYPAGEFQGSEPSIASQNLPDGERVRGWVWFGIPQGSEPASIVLLPPRPVLRLHLL